MDFIKRVYRSSLDFVGDTPSLRRDWRWLALYGAVIYVLVLALRLSFAGRWDHPELWVNGERLLSTHDSYFWLAKAKGVGLLDGYPLSQLVRWGHDWLGLSYGAIGFWAPAVIVSLVGCVCYFWGALIAGRTAGIIAGLAGSFTPGFYYRSRLGYFDTDMFTLLVPLLVTLMLATWLSPFLRRGWFVPAGGEGDEQEKPPSYWMIFLFGLVTRFVSVFHYDILVFDVVLSFTAIGLVLVNGRPGRRLDALYGMIVFILAAFPGGNYGVFTLWPIQYLVMDLGMRVGVSSIVGILFAACLSLLLERRPGKFPDLLGKAWVCAIMLVGVALLTNLVSSPATDVWNKVSAYLFPAGGNVVSQTMGPAYPSVVQSIIEAKLVPLSEILSRGAFTSWLGWLALLCTLVAMLLRPAMTMLLPLLVVHLASVKMGIRFSMFGGAVLMVSLSVCTYWLSRVLFGALLPSKYKISLAVQGLLGLALTSYIYTAYGELPLTPVIPRAHAEALAELGRLAPKDAMIWTWWDWGYASQYYAGLETVVDGGKHAGRDVYPVGFALATPSGKKANRMVAFSAQYPTPSAYELGLSPAVEWDKIPRNRLSAALEEELSRTDYPATPPQYLVVSWKDMRIIKWITYFGNWNLQTGETREASSGNYDPGEMGINVQRGAVMDRQGGGGLVKDITVLDWNSSQSQSYFMNSMSPQLLPKRQHLLVNKVTRQSVIMDRVGYESLMRKLFTDDPNDPEISKYFKIVVDKLPFARIYEVIQ